MYSTAPDNRQVGHVPERYPGVWRPTPLVAGSAVSHAGAVAFAVVWPDAWIQAAGALAFNHALLTAAGMWPRSQMLGPNWTRLPADAAARGEIAITIDDGPDPEVTPQVLEILERYGVRATFFCIGKRAAQHPELCREMIRCGHAIESHSYAHRWYFQLLGMGALARELQAVQDTLTEITGQSPMFFRAPAGLRSPLLDPVLARMGLQLASWTKRGFDTRRSDPDRITASLLRNLQGGDILLLHDGNARRTSAGRAVVVEVLPRVLDAAKRAQLVPVTLRSLVV
jgi:peptidoglycan-N-acetylglucosamine deacetylase